MKRGAIDHPKMLILAAELDIIKSKQPTLGAAVDGLSGRLMAVGIMESIWQWCAKYAIQGDIGKWPNAVICQGIGYGWDADELISVLVKCRWLDKSKKHRLVIHDVQAHADNNWREYLDRAGLTWFDGSPARCGVSGRPRKPYETSTYIPQTGVIVDVVSPEPKPKPKPKPKPEPEPCISNSRPSENVAEIGNTGTVGGVSSTELPPAPTSVSDSNDQAVPDPPTIPITQFNPEPFIQALKLRLKWSPNGKIRPQVQSDETSFEIIANHVGRGDIGPPRTVCQMVATESARCAKAGIDNPVAKFMAWFKRELEQHGHEWNGA